jgi:signal transduction histidine kinase
VELRIRRFDGTEGTVLVSAAPIKDEEGHLLGAVGVNMDITDRKQIEERYTTLFNLVREGFAHYKAVYDDSGKLIDIFVEEINPAGAAISGVPRENQVGRKWRQVWPGVSEQLLSIYQRADETGEIVRFDDHNQLTGRIYDVIISRTKPGEFVVTFSDITERKRAEETLAAYARDLERSNRDLQEFAFVASHDLQEPLRKIETFGSLLLETTANLNEHQRDLVTRMDKSTNRMRSMVDGLLQLSRLETHAQPFQRVNLNEVIKEVLSDLEAQIRRTGGTVEVCDLPVIEADPQQMRRFFQNLIGNALKFQPPGGKPRVKVCPEQDAPGFIKILVADNGIGFDEAHATHLFEPFKRLVGKSEYEGSGMGLAICRKIVERHNGEITVRSQPGQGTTFIVTLPIHQDPTTQHSLRRLQHNGGQSHVSDR